MTLRDRIRRWWNPAQWEDDHPAERKQREHNKHAIGRFFSNPGKNFYEGRDVRHMNEGDFKKPRY